MRPVQLLNQSHALLADRVRLAIMVTLAASDDPIDFIDTATTIDRASASTRDRSTAHSWSWIHRSIQGALPSFVMSSHGLVRVSHFAFTALLLMVPFLVIKFLGA